jgi:hypothetical protein
MKKYLKYVGINVENITEFMTLFIEPEYLDAFKKLCENTNYMKAGLVTNNESLILDGSDIVYSLQLIPKAESVDFYKELILNTQPKACYTPTKFLDFDCFDYEVTYLTQGEISNFNISKILKYKYDFK